MSDDRPVQHTPKHLQKDSGVFDPRHPAASAFAVAQPAAGVVADDVPEKGQNLRGGPSATEAQAEYGDQREVLAKQHDETLRLKSGVGDVTPLEVDGDKARPVSGSGPAKDEPKPSVAKDAAPKPKTF